MNHPQQGANAPLLDAFGPALTQRVAALVRQEPALAVRLALAPARALHASGAFLQAPACADWTSLAKRRRFCAWTHAPYLVTRYRDTTRAFIVSWTACPFQSGRSRRSSNSQR